MTLTNTRRVALAAITIVLASACWALESTVRQVQTSSVGLPVTVCESPSPVDRAPQSGTLRWAWGDAGGVGDATVEVYSDGLIRQCRSHSYAVAGQYEGTLSVTPGDAGQASREIGVSVSEQDEPRVAASSTCSCHLRADLSASMLDSETFADQKYFPSVVEQFQWTFGDGTTATTTSAFTSHTFPAPGSYTVSVTEVVPSFRPTHTEYGEVRSWSSVTVSVGS